MTRSYLSHGSLVCGRFIRWRVLAGMAFLALALPVPAEELGNKVLTALGKATYEVVLEKPTSDSLSYEKELPFDLLPFKERNDRYQSVGTAFALEGGHYVSAAHVMPLASDSVRRRIHLRDPHGRIVELDQVLKYSIARDFIVFTVKDHRPQGVLRTSVAAKKNDKVFAVGNALGDGIIVRDGLYTSDTPEEEEGRWKWLRFSAAASPGNSGGPLVDRDGRVLGVVLRKSQNENLNFALPIREVLKAPANKAEVRLKAIFKLDITDRTLQGKVDETLDLPLGYEAFGRALQARLSQFATSLSDRFKTTYRDDMFPQAAGAQALLYRSNVTATFPRMLAKQRDGTWDAVMPSERRDAELGRNGKLVFGQMGNFIYLRVVAPDDAPVAQLQKDSKRFMDLLLRGLYFSRSFGSERVRITSLGAAREEAVHVDAYQRKWQVRRWTIEHSDEKIVTYALPQPDGFAILLNAADESASYMYELDMKTLADYAFVSYYGTLKQWQEFLAARDMLPGALESIAIDADYGKRFSYRSARMSFSYPADLMKVAENSDLHLKLSYFLEDGRVVWDVSSVTAGEDKDNSTFLMINRQPRPPESLPDDERWTWESLASARMPYAGDAFYEESRTVIASVLGPQKSRAELSAASVLYSVAYSVEGTQDKAQMADRLERFRAGVQAGGR